MEYSSEEKKKILEFLDQCKKLVESGSICEYNNMSDTLHMSFCVRKKTNDYVG